MRFAGKRYHPYFACQDIALFCTALVAFFIWPLSLALKLISGVGITLLSYSFYLRWLKPFLFGSRSRSLIQDSLIVILPLLAFSYFVIRVPSTDAMRFLGLTFPLYFGWTRIGCFLSGCCYGKPCASFGVTYPESCLRSESGLRQFVAPKDTLVDVFPVQAVEAFFHFFYFTLILVLPNWNILDFAVLYLPTRFVLDFYRNGSARPRYFGADKSGRGRISEAQLFCVVLWPIFLLLKFK